MQQHMCFHFNSFKVKINTGRGIMLRALHTVPLFGFVKKTTGKILKLFYVFSGHSELRNLC